VSKLKGKVAVVTGASKGIGAAIATHLAAEGASVVVNYSSARDGADRVVAEITKQGGKAIAVHGDVSKSADVQKLFKEAHTAYGQVDVLVNNAGVFQFDALETLTEDEFHREFNINVLGPLLATKEALPYFPSTGGSVINVGSVISESPMAGASIYSATKGALDTMSRALALELAGRRIRVNVVAPGGVETEGTHRLGMIGSDLEKQIVASTPLGRIGQPDDIARITVFLASDDSGWITGERITASGGYR
jgi:3-oxoacyl-[acyl-carrier protein] reductase